MSAESSSWIIRLGRWGAAGTAYYWFAKFYDYILYTFVIVKWGPVRGGAVILIASFLLDYFSVFYYAKLGVDVFGFEELKNLRNRNRIVSKLFALSDLVAFFVGSFVSNPFLVTIYLKKEHDGKMNKKDWAIFASSFVLSNVVWISTIYLGYNWIVKAWVHYF